MKAKKTIMVNEIKELANKMLADSPNEAREKRIAVACFMSDVLDKTRNYRGFCYLPSESNIHSGFYGKDCRINFF